MRSLRQLFRRSGLFTSEQRRRRSEMPRRGDATKRRLSNELLEKRELLAGDILASNHNYWNPYDVNDDGTITARDALGVINYLSRSGEGELAGSSASRMFYDVNADHNISASDALSVINAISRGEEVGELVELLLTVRNLNDQQILPDSNGEINLEVGQLFDLEVSYDDLRLFNQQLGVFQLFADISVSQPDVLVPLLNETQRLIIGGEILTIASNSVTFTIPEAPPGVSGGSLSYVSPINAFANNTLGEVRNALLAFGYTTSQFEISSLDFGNDDLGFQIHWVGDGFGNIDLPNIGVDVNETNPAQTIPTQTVEFAAFLPDGVTPNPEAVRFNLNTFSRTFNDNERFYSSQNRGNFNGHSFTTQSPAQFNVGEEIVGATSGAIGIVTNVVQSPGPERRVEYVLKTTAQFQTGETATGQDSSATSTVETVSDTIPFGFNGVGGLGMVPTEGGGIPQLTDDGSFLQPFDAFSLRVFLKAPVTQLVVGVNPGEDPEAVLLYGRDDAVPQDMVLIETTDTNNNGIAQVVINAIGDESVLSIAPTDATKREGNSGTTNFTFTVTRSGDTSGAASVDFAVSGSGANPADAADFGGSFPSGTINFDNGQASRVITISVSGDTDVEPDNGFTVALSNPVNATLGTASATGSIQNDDATLSIAATDATKDEGDSGTTNFTFTVTRTGDTSVTASANFAVTGSGAAPADAADFGGALPSGTVTFDPGQSSKVITIGVSGDTVVEADNGFTVTLSNPVGAALVTTSASGLIRNDDATLSIAATDANKAEGNSGTTNFTFTVTRTGDTSRAASANFIVTGSGADPANAADFVGGALPAGTVNFAAGQTSQVITIEVSGDTDPEPDNGFTVTLSNPVGATLATATADGLIQNDDGGLSIAATDANKREGNSGSTAFTFTVTRSGDTSGAASVNYSVTGSGANPANAADFVGGVLPSGTVNFAPEQTSEVITINVSGDTDVEPDNGFTVALSNAMGGTLGTATATGLIQNDDASLSIAATDATKAEGNSGTTNFTFTVTRTGDTSGTASANFAVTGSGADPADAADFGGTLPSGTVTFDPGQSSKVITIGVSGDTVVEADNGFTVTLSNAVGATLGTATATGLIQNDDSAGQLSIQATATVNEKAGTVVLQVTRTNGTSGEVKVDFKTEDDSAEAGLDYTAKMGTLTFPDGITTQTIEIEILDDTLGSEGDETFKVVLSGPTGGATLGNLTSIVTITDVNEPPTVSGPVVIGARSEEDAPFTVNEAALLANASDREGDPLAVSNIVYVSGDNRGVTIGANSLSVNPAAYGSLVDGQSAVIVYRYSISDGVNSPISQTATLTINGFNDPPVARDDTGATTFAGSPVTIRVLDNDDAGDGEDQDLTVTLASSANGTTQIVNGTIVFTPADGFLGQATIQYTIQDEQGKTDSANAFVMVESFSPSSISGFVFVDNVENLQDFLNGHDPIRNNVKDADESGLAGAEVRLVSAASENSSGVAVEETVLTGLDGSFTFDNLAPGTYHVIYNAPNTVVFEGLSELVRVVPEAGNVQLVGANFAVWDTPVLDQLDILASTIQRRRVAGGGGQFSFDASGNQQFLTDLIGYDNVEFVELSLSEDMSEALLTIIEVDGDVRSALLTKDNDFTLYKARDASGNVIAMGVEIFGDFEDFFGENSSFEALAATAVKDDFRTYRDAIDRVLAEL